MNLSIGFHGKHMVVVGGTSGINLGIAHAFAQQGANVSVVSRSEEKVRAAVTSLSKYGHKVYGESCDVRDFDRLGNVFENACSNLGGIDVLVSGAAGNFLCEASSMSANGFKSVVDIDLVGSFNVMRQAYFYLNKANASVINITAPQSTIPMRFQAHACAAKAGLDHLVRVLALEWGSQGIRVNAISPGPIDGTEGFNRLIAPSIAVRNSAVEQVPLRRFGELDDIANLALFLASDFATYISGAVIPCDGGGAINSVRPALESAGERMQTSVDGSKLA